MRKREEKNFKFTLSISLSFFLSLSLSLSLSLALFLFLFFKLSRGALSRAAASARNGCFFSLPFTCLLTTLTFTTCRLKLPSTSQPANFPALTFIFLVLFLATVKRKRCFEKMMHLTRGTGVQPLPLIQTKKNDTKRKRRRRRKESSSVLTGRAPQADSLSSDFWSR